MSDSPRPVDLGRTAAALRARDACRLRYEAALTASLITGAPAEIDERVDAEMVQLFRLDAAVGEAFALDTADRNQRETALRMGACEWLRRLVEKYDEPILYGPPSLKLALVGLAPGREQSPDALSIQVPLGPESGTGRRLADLLGRPVATVARTANVLSCPSLPMTGPAAYARGRRLRERLVYEDVTRTVVLGMDAARLMGLRHGAAASDLWFKWEVTDGLYYAVSPHPSSRSLWWNDAKNVERARSFFSELSALKEAPR